MTDKKQWFPTIKLTFFQPLNLVINAEAPDLEQMRRLAEEFLAYVTKLSAGHHEEKD